MADFQVSLGDSITAIGFYAENNLLNVIDYSNYNTNSQVGHTQGDFSLFRKIVIAQPDGTEYVFSSIGDGDVACVVPNGANLPITDSYSYTSGDGVYEAKLYSFPTWNSLVTYPNSVFVYYNGKFYHSISAGNTNHNPVTATSWWEEVPFANLESRLFSYYNEVYPYIISMKIAVVCDMEKCFIRMMAQAVAGDDCYSNAWGKLCYNDTWVKANALYMALKNIQGLVDREDWSGVSSQIENGKEICCCGGLAHVDSSVHVVHYHRN